MIKKLQKMRSKRGFTLVELIVVIAIIMILISVVLASLNTTTEVVNRANSTSSDFYSALQTEFTHFQMFDAPLTTTLSNKYSESVSNVSNHKYGGLMYYPDAGGNYPIDPAKVPTKLRGDPNDANPANRTVMPEAGKLYFEFRVYAGRIQYVDWDYTINGLLAREGSVASNMSELGAVLMQEMKERVTYQDGYYYAKVSYTKPSVTPGTIPTKHDYRTSAMTVEWTAYTADEIKSSKADSLEFGQQNFLKSGVVCGVCLPTSTAGKPGATRLGMAASGFYAFEGV